jgi:hypothetical protein
MDTQSDFVFLMERVAQKFNPLQEGEYIVLQTRTKNLRLYPLHRGFDWREAKSFCDFENMASDFNHYSERVVYQGKLHHVNDEGGATKVSFEQDWKILEEYFIARFTPDADCEIEVCDCSYPVFYSYRSVVARNGETNQVWLPITCLENDFGREITYCPNCTISLGPEEIEEEEDSWFDWEEVPTVCIGCSYYNINSPIPCTVHPLGIDAEVEVCPDYWQQS